MFEELGFNNYSDDDDPYEVSTLENVMKYLNEYKNLYKYYMKANYTNTQIQRIC